MKKKLIGIYVVTLVVISFVGYSLLVGYSSLTGHSSLDEDVLLANIEALAQTENNDGVKTVQQGTAVEYDDEGNMRIIHFCNCIGVGILDCPC